jgi:hypothetical protein
MKAMMGFTRGMMSLPMPWPIWLAILMAANFVGSIYFFETLEAKVVLAVFMAGAMFMMAIFAAKGFVRLLGIGHILWVPMVPWLWTRLDQAGPDSALGYWIMSVMIINSLSLIIDAVDVVRYLKGEREPYISVAN